MTVEYKIVGALRRDSDAFYVLSAGFRQVVLLVGVLTTFSATAGGLGSYLTALLYVFIFSGRFQRRFGSIDRGPNGHSTSLCGGESRLLLHRAFRRVGLFYRSLRQIRDQTVG